jgi:imidazolonepropionase-like amidohydrolase
MPRLVLSNVNLLDGDNPATPHQTVVIMDDRISYVGAAPPSAEPGDRVIDLEGRTVMPGMATCHFHSTYHNVGGGPYGSEYPPSYQALVSHKNLMNALERGFTIVVGAGAARDVEPGVKQAIEDGLVPGPRFVPSGRELSTTGHANDLTAPWHWGMPSVGAARVCDGPEQFRYAVRDEIKRGVEVIKLFVTGGHAVPGSKDRMEMTRDELAAAIDTAHSRNALARGHIVGKGPIMLAIELGMDIIDHGDDMDDEVITALVQTGTFVAPSVYFPKTVASLMEPSWPALAADMRKGVESMCEVLPKADAAGVRLLLGDDYGGPGLPHGSFGPELRTYVEDAGLPPLSVIRWATRHGAELLGRIDELGTIAEGKLADLLVVDADPSLDIGAVADAKPRAVLKAGRIVAGALPEN